MNAALAESEKVHLVFIFDPAQKNHSYFSTNAFQFMIESLVDLEKEIKALGGTLNFLTDTPTDALEKIKEATNFTTLYLNQDYTPFAQQRDKKITEWCARKKIQYKALHDYTLNPPKATTKDNGEPYKVFTPYYRNAAQIKVREPETEKLNKISDQELSFSFTLKEITHAMGFEKSKNLALKGGRKNALEIYKHLNKKYDEERDFPAKDGTSHLSAHHKFGTISMRESYYSLTQFYGPSHTIISELYWHDFFTHVGYFFPHVFKESFTPKFKNLAWENDEEKFKAWCEGQTGFPIVDAGMRELNKTGYMHNRVRMITASFLIKNLEINWQWGERYFAQKLIDYDPAINNGNWQWAASTGVDAQPFFRIFNPWRQQERFDKQNEYIKKWIPELKDISPKEINNWLELGPSLFTSYPAPIVEHKLSSAKTQKKYKDAHEAHK